MDFLVDLNAQLARDIKYLIRLEPGVQTPEETLAKGSGSCRDSGWLLVQILRHLGLAARFVSGYLIQLTADVKSLDGPSGPEKDFTDLHAWAEVYLPGAGWIGLDPTSGLFAGEGTSAARLHARAGLGGAGDRQMWTNAKSSLPMRCRSPGYGKRRASPSPTREEQWQAIDRLGHAVDAELTKHDVRLTMGGEPTFISMDDPDGEEWKTAALGPDKRTARSRPVSSPAPTLRRSRSGAFRPGQMVSRRATAALVAQLFLARRRRAASGATIVDRGRDSTRQGDGCDGRGFSPRVSPNGSALDHQHIFPAYEDLFYYLWREHRLPANVDPFDSRLEDALERERLDACAYPRAKTSRRSRSAGGARLCDRTVAQRSLVFALGALLSVARRFADGLPPAARLAAVDERQRLPAYFSAGSGSAAAAACHSRANPLSARAQRNP